MESTPPETLTTNPRGGSSAKKSAVLRKRLTAAKPASPETCSFRGRERGEKRVGKR